MGNPFACNTGIGFMDSHTAKDEHAGFATGAAALADLERAATGASAGLAGHFDASFYIATYPDIRAGVAGRPRDVAATLCEEHWMKFGRDEVAGGYRPISPDYDEDAYLGQRPDVRAAIAGGDYLYGYDHWLRRGRVEMAQADRRVIFEQHPASRPAVLTDALLRGWTENGYLILRNLFPADRCDRVNRRIGDFWNDRASAPPVAIDIHIHTGAERVRFANAPIEMRSVPHKIYDLVLCEGTVQDLALDAALVDVLRWILGDDPVCMSSLNMELGTTQGFHQDTLYMPGKRPGGMAAAWIALEDVRPGAGPLAYYPGSHLIPLFQFSSGQPKQIDAEFGDYDHFMMTEVAARAIDPVTFVANKGDVLIWNERLYHAGSAIQDMSLTRKTLITHYWRANDLPGGGMQKAAHGHYWDRPWN